MRRRAAGAVTVVTAAAGFASAAGVDPGAVTGGANDCGSTADSATTGFSITGEAVGVTETAGDLADRDDRRLDLTGAVTSAGTSWGLSTFCSVEGSVTPAGSPEGAATPAASPEGAAACPCDFIAAACAAAAI